MKNLTKFKIQPLWMYFKLWINEYKHFFKNEPFLVEENERGVLYRFKGVTPFLSLWVDEFQCIIMVEYQGECWDIIWHGDCVAEKDPEKGFYCSLCIPKYRKFYDSLDTLYFEHSFLALVRWCNKNFTISNRLYFYKHGGCTSVSLSSPKNISREYEVNSVFIEPILIETLLPSF